MVGFSERRPFGVLAPNLTDASGSVDSSHQGFDDIQDPVLRERLESFRAQHPVRSVMPLSKARDLMDGFTRIGRFCALKLVTYVRETGVLALETKGHGRATSYSITADQLDALVVLGHRMYEFNSAFPGEKRIPLKSLVEDTIRDLEGSHLAGVVHPPTPRLTK